MLEKLDAEAARKKTNFTKLVENTVILTAKDGGGLQQLADFDCAVKDARHYLESQEPHATRTLFWRVSADDQLAHLQRRRPDAKDVSEDVVLLACALQALPDALPARPEAKQEPRS
ncbi:hypothetical protein ACIRST_39105 [Kitasatospora sp. NPDC101447]|uniref:hypothetical protein n=1 Tax=Kitasatospora sp. NPDC101447 TaxID=3364102 RepID=UPI003803D709